MIDGPMPTTSSAGKRLRQSAKKRLHNRIAKKIVKTSGRKALATVATKDFEKAEAEFRTAVAKIDKAGVRRVLHPNTAARRKSRLAREYNAALAKAKSDA
jgi:small subunit ribosomal protein S20